MTITVSTPKRRKGPPSSIVTAKVCRTFISACSLQPWEVFCTGSADPLDGPTSEFPRSWVAFLICITLSSVSVAYHALTHPTVAFATTACLSFAEHTKPISKTNRLSDRMRSSTHRSMVGAFVLSQVEFPLFDGRNMAEKFQGMDSI